MNFADEKFQKILKANHILSSTLNLSQLLRSIMSLATEIVDAETSSLLLYEEKSEQLVFNLALSDKESQLKDIRLKIGEGIAGCCAKDRKTMIVMDVASDTRWTNRTDHTTSFKTNSVIAVPLLYRDQLLGVIEAINKKNGDFNKEDADVLEAFAAQSAIAIVNAKNFENLQEEKGKLEAIFSQMSDGVIFIDSIGKKILANNSSEKILGKENIIHSTIQKIFSDFKSEPDIEEILNSTEKTISFEFIRNKDKAHYLSGVATRIFDSAENPIGFIIVFRDVTEEKRENFLKTNFISLVSHKLRTPLVSITGFGPMLLEDETLTEFQRKAVSSIYRQGKNLASLVDKLIYFTLLDTENLELANEVNTFSVVVERSAAILKSYLTEKSANIEIDENIKELPRLVMDGEKIEVVIRNLIENAVKFNKNENKTIKIEAVRSDAGFGLAFVDNGPGIPPEEREKIFQKFYQIEESFTGQVEGTGLGLALVRRIVEAHGGNVGLESAIGSGSRFYFVLPKISK